MSEVWKRKSSVRVTVFVLLLTMTAWLLPANMQEASAAEGSASRIVTRDADIPTPTEVYEAMIALKE